MTTMATAETDRRDRKLDLAARAGWLYYVAGNTQDEIAGKLDVSRQAAQRLVAMSVSEKLIKFRLDYPLAKCLDLAAALSRRFGLEFCEVAPSDPQRQDAVDTLATTAAAYLEQLLMQKAPLTVGFSTGRTLRATVSQVAPMRRPDHRIVSVVGTMSQSGRVSPYDVVLRLAERIGAECYPMPTPVVVSSAEERRIMQAHQAFHRIEQLAGEARVHFVGVAEIGWQCPMHREGFIADTDLSALVDASAVGEIAGWPFDQDGRFLDIPFVDRLTGLRPTVPPRPQRIGIAAGENKRRAIHAALVGGLLSGLITDEATAQALLDDRF